MHQWPSEVFQVGVLAFPFFLEIKHNFPQYCTCRSENLTDNSSYIAGGNVYIFRVDVYGCTEIKPVQSLMRCKVTWAICVILYSLQEISNELLPPSKLQNSRWVTKRVMSNTFFEKFSVFLFFFIFSPKLVCYIGLKCSEITAAMLFSIFQFSIFCKFWTLLIPSLT